MVATSAQSPAEAEAKPVASSTWEPPAVTIDRLLRENDRLRADWLDVGRTAQGLQAELLDANKRFEMAVATTERFRDRFRKAERAIAKARKWLRAGGVDRAATPFGFKRAYEALDWRQR